MSNNNTQTQRILDAASSVFLLATLTGTGGHRFTKKINGSAALVAANHGAEVEAVKDSSLNLLPDGLDAEWKALKQAYGAVRPHFDKVGMPFSHAGDDGTGKRASGERAFHKSVIADGSFLAEHSRLLSDLDSKREAFATALSGIIDRIEHRGLLGDEFDRADYPTPDEIRAGWKFEPIEFRPIAGGEGLKGMNLPGSIVEDIERGLEARIAADVQYGQQRLAGELMDSVSRLVKRTKALNGWINAPDDQPGKAKRQPQIRGSAVANVKESLAKLRQYALPETEAGRAIMARCDRLEHELDLTTLEPERIKTSVATMDKLASLDVGDLFDAEEPAPKHGSGSDLPAVETMPGDCGSVVGDGSAPTFEEREPEAQPDPFAEFADWGL